MVREMRVPGGAGVHRVNWDLRHGVASDPMETWERQGSPELPRTIERRGPFVSAGTYGVTLVAGGEERTRQIRVGLDPAMAELITLTQQRDRETFLLGLLAALQRIEEAQESTPDEENDGLAELRQQAQSLYVALNGEAVRPGSLYPPTLGHRDLKRRIERRLDEILPQSP